MTNIFSERLKKLRLQKGLTLEELGKQVNIAKSGVYKWENGQSQPNQQTLLLLAKIFNTTVSYLLGETNTPERNQDWKYYYNKLLENNPNNSIHFYNAEDLIEEDYLLVQQTIDTLKSKNKLKK
ncbi:MAG: helix-turn-helix domain-containing protein [Fusobacteriaceae bacterium]